jgi:hypothetical protein
MTLKEQILSNINTHIEIKEKRPDIYQVYAPFYHEDGDMIEVFVEKSPNNPEKVRICDYGLTLMKLSYDMELKGENQKVYNQILSENRLDETEGNIFFESDLENLNSSFLHYVQSISKVSSLHYFKHKRIKRMFYEILFGYVDNNLKKFQPEKDFIPIPKNPEDKVDIVFKAGKLPIYMFGVPNDNKAMDVVVSCQAFQLANLNYKSVVVYENFEELSKKTRNRILRATDKPFMDFDQFREESSKYFEKEIA